MTFKQAENVVAVGLKRDRQTESSFSYQLDELRRLVETAGGSVVQEFTQTRLKPDPATLIGQGKLQEIAGEIARLGVKTVVFDDDLSPAQQKNIEKALPAKVIDRTRLILDIFAKRARSREGQLQVELAQLNYLVPRLTGAWRGFSQQVGGIGTRGPGERKIEVERRYVRERIKHLKRDIEEVRRHRSRARFNRQAVPVPQIALVGYTNVGKSTLLNKLVGDGSVYADDKLFATLDPTTRRVKLPGGQWVLFTDTVGFIQKLPPLLVEAFQATLEEAAEATLLVHVVDADADNREEQRKNVVATLEKLGAGDVPTLTVFNKADLLAPAQRRALAADGRLPISSRNGEGLDAFLAAVEQRLDELLVEVTFDLPHTKRGLLGDIYRTGHVVHERPTETGTHLRVRMDPGNWRKISHQLNNNGEPS